MDNPVDGLGDCESAYVAADHKELGVSLAKWLIAYSPTSKEVGIVTLPPSQYASNDARVSGFRDPIVSAGYNVVATVVTDLTLDKTRTLATREHPSEIKTGSTVLNASNVQAYLDATGKLK